MHRNKAKRVERRYYSGVRKKLWKQRMLGSVEYKFNSK